MKNIFLYKNLNNKKIIYTNKNIKNKKYFYKKFIKMFIYFFYNLIIKKIYNFFTRIKHYGKSYTLKKKRKVLICRFGQSHFINIMYKNIFVIKAKKKRKTFFIKLKKITTFIKLKRIIKKIRPINHYTKRGLRLGNYKFIKRFGKISQAFSKLH